MTLRKTVERYCLKKLGRKPDLGNPRSFNDKIQWLKLYDHTEAQKVCCDKLAARKYVADRIGAEHIVPVLQVADCFAGLKFRAPSIIKATHDSGSTTIVRDAASWGRASERIERAMGRTYGVASGEWAYAFAERAVIVEDVLTENNDYRFHCCEGRIKWVQISTPKDPGPIYETILDPDGEYLPLHLACRMIPTREPYAVPANWPLMKQIAETLSKEFRYVRVDLYSSKGRVYFSELTFWPKAGCYTTKDNLKFGQMLDFDMSFKRPPLA